MKTALLIAAASVACASATLRGAGADAGRLTNDGDLRPEVVAHLLSEVGKSWVHSRYEVLEGRMSDAEALADVEASCTKVASSVVAGSGGRRERVKEYMENYVCKKSKDKKLCLGFAADVTSVMIGDMYFNRKQLNYTKLCHGMYDGMITDAAKAQKELIEREVEETQKEQAVAREAAEKAFAEHEKAVEAEKEADVEKAAEMQQTLAEQEAERKKKAAQAAWEQKQHEKEEVDRTAHETAVEAQKAQMIAEEKEAAARLAEAAAKKKGLDVANVTEGIKAAKAEAKAEAAAEAHKAPADAVAAAPAEGATEEVPAKDVAPVAAAVNATAAPAASASATPADAPAKPLAQALDHVAFGAHVAPATGNATAAPATGNATATNATGNATAETVKEQTLAKAVEHHAFVAL